MVIFQTPDGNPGYNQFESLEEAVRFVEKLRNEQSVETARMFALEEVKFEFKSYFRVELDPLMVGPGGSEPSHQNGSESSSSPFGGPPRAETSGFAPPPPVEPPPVAEPAGVGAPPPPTFMTVPGDDQGENTTRRGLFGR